MKSFVVNNWSQLLSFSSQFPSAMGSMSGQVFRGQASVEWELLPSLTRELRKGTIDTATALELEEILTAEFTARAYNCLDTNVLPRGDDPMSWWIFMQHHGAPTRMLDWTASFCVAAYFAAIEQPEHDGVIWCVPPKLVREPLESQHGSPEIESGDAQRTNFLQSSAPNHLVFLTGKRKTSRMAAQQGLFTVSRNVLTDHGQVIKD